MPKTPRQIAGIKSHPVRWDSPRCWQTFVSWISFLHHTLNLGLEKGWAILSARHGIRYWGRPNSDVNSSRQGLKRQKKSQGWRNWGLMRVIVMVLRLLIRLVTPMLWFKLSLQWFSFYFLLFLLPLIFFLKVILCIWVFGLYVCLCTTCSENWSYRWLSGTMWFLGTRSGSSERPTSALNLPAISPAPIYYLCMCESMCMNDACVWVQVPSQACDQRRVSWVCSLPLLHRIWGCGTQVAGPEWQGPPPTEPSPDWIFFFKSMQMWLKPNASMPALEHCSLWDSTRIIATTFQKPTLQTQTSAFLPAAVGFTP